MFQSVSLILPSSSSNLILEGSLMPYLLSNSVTTSGSLL
nr:MAG TPA: hypothetical protein [Caudoviricetes sp.]